MLMNKIIFKNPVFILLFLTAFSRVIAFYFYGDTQLENEWRILVNNLSEKGVLGLYVLDDQFEIIPKSATGNETVLPSAFMPPLYAYFIFIIKSIFENFINYINVIIFFQIFLSTVATYFFYKIIYASENLNFSFYSTLFFSLFPINIYSTVQISSISIQVFFLVYFFYILKIFSIEKKIKSKNLAIFSIISGFLILLRGEFILFYFFTLVYFFVFYLKNFKVFFISLFLTIMVISPYLTRNYYQFNTFTITKSLGYNLLKGNNPDFRVEGNPTYLENIFKANSSSFKFDKNFEITLDNFYKEKALENMKNDPIFYLKNYVIKVFSFLTIDLNSTYNKYYNFFHIFPKILISILSFLGGIIVLSKKTFSQYLGIYFFLNILFFSIFFILPRYSLILLPVQIILSLEFLKYLLRKFSD